MKLGFYGFGHLAKAVVAGLLKKEQCTPSDIFVLAKSDLTKNAARAEGFEVCLDAQQLFDRCDVVFLAIKPAVFRELAPSFSSLDCKNTKIVSFMASIGQADLEKTFHRPVLRMMPTVAIETGKDIIGMTDPGGFEEIKARFDAVGRVHVLKEEALDRLTVVASCGPGFAAKVLDSYACSCMRLGFSKEEALSITASIFSFAAAKEGEDPFHTLATQVATKGGVTEAGILKMEGTLEDTFDLVFQTALEKAAPQK